MAEPAVSYTVEDDIAVIVLERAAARNAINIDILEGLEAAWHRFNQADERVAVLAARGENFSVGLDLKAPPPDMWRCVPGVGVDVAKPIVAAASGWCVGGGLILVQMSDLCVAAESTKFLYPEAKVGVTGGLIAGLAARIPVKIAMELMLLGEPIDAERAYSVGLINRVVPDGEEFDATMAIARDMANAAAHSVRMTKRAVHRSYEVMGMRQALEAALDIDILIESTMTPEKAEFKRIREGEGLKAALAWRDAKFRED